MISTAHTVRLRKPFNAMVVGMLGFAAYKAGQVPVAHLAAAVLVGVAAVTPLYIWCRGWTGGGVPAYPLFAFSNVWTGFLPVLSGSLVGTRYTDEEVVTGAVVESLFVGAGTWFWYRSTGAPVREREHFTGFPDAGSTLPFFGFLLLACSFHTSLFWQLIPNLPGSWYSLVRTCSLGMSTLSTAVLSFRWGAGRLTGGEKVLFGALLLLQCALDTAGLMIHGAASLLFISYASYTLSRGRIPVLLCLATLAVLTLLHLGKWPLRAQYWSKGPGAMALHEDLSSLYGRWFEYGIEELTNSSGGEKSAGKESAAINRASTLQMVCLVVNKSPDPVPYLAGATYEIIPELLIPRAIHPDKPASHEGTYLMAIAYGLQTREATKTTTIGFGPVAESYANFGVFGVLVVGALFGHLLGKVAADGRGLPITAARNLLALLAMTSSLQTESPLSVSVTTFFQSAVLLCGVALVMMKPCPLREPT